MPYTSIVARVNRVANFFADTDGIDYTEGLSAADIQELDAANRECLRLFPELKRMGY